jgi:hypothetical protein
MMTALARHMHVVQQSRRYYEKKLREGKQVVVETTDRYGRFVEKIFLDDRYINREMVREGPAWAYRKYLIDQSLLEDEAQAPKAGTLGYGHCSLTTESLRGNGEPTFADTPPSRGGIPESRRHSSRRKGTHLSSGPWLPCGVRLGHGIAPEDLPLMFDRFYRGQHQAQDASHAGLRLAIARGIVERHESTLQVTSRLNTGTRFSFQLPVWTPG